MGVWLDNIILIILAVLVIIIFVGSLYAFFYAIFLFIFSAWADDKIQKAWNSIRYMLLWVIFTIFLLFIFPVILKRVWLANAEMFDAPSIFNMAVQIMEYIFTFGKESLDTYQAWGPVWDPSNWGNANWSLSPTPVPNQPQPGQWWFEL